MSNQDKIEVGSQPLNDLKRETFCLLYVDEPFFPQEIYKKAGYRPKSSGALRSATSRLLHDVNIQARIAWLRKERNNRLGRSADDVIDGIYTIRDRCLSGHEVIRDRHGDPIEVDVYVTGKDGHQRTIKRCVIWKFDVQGAKGASELLAKYYGILTDNISVNDGDRIKKEIDDEATDIVANLIANQKRVAHSDDGKEVKEDKDKTYPLSKDVLDNGKPIPGIRSQVDDGSLEVIA